jgi:mRNA interferase RelE/StbE
MFQIEWRPKAYKQLAKIRHQDRKSIMDAVDALADFPNCKNIKVLRNHQYSYRLRVGNYRVFFNTFNQIQIVSVEEVKKRDERTY